MADEKKTRSKTKVPPAQGQDLTVIEHIDKSLQTWFNNALNINSYYQLSTTPVKKISETAKRDGRVLPVIIIKKMIAEAKKLVSIDDQAAINQHITKDENKLAGGKNWKEYATFVMYLERYSPEHVSNASEIDDVRVTLHHIETGDERTWSRINVNNLCQWLVEQFNIIEKTVQSINVTKSKVNEVLEQDKCILVNDIIIKSTLIDSQEQYMRESGVPKVYAIKSNYTYSIIMYFKILDSIFADSLKDIRVLQRQYNMNDESLITSESKFDNVKCIENTLYSGTINLNSLSKGVYKVNLTLQFAQVYLLGMKIDAGVMHVL
jgi:hypothetical protein